MSLMLPWLLYWLYFLWIFRQQFKNFKDSLAAAYSDLGVNSGDSGTEEGDLDLGKLEAEAKEVAALASRDGPAFSSDIKKTFHSSRFTSASRSDEVIVPAGGVKGWP